MRYTWGGRWGGWERERERERESEKVEIDEWIASPGYLLVTACLNNRRLPRPCLSIAEDAAVEAAAHVLHNVHRHDLVHLLLRQRRADHVVKGVLSRVVKLTAQLERVIAPHDNGRPNAGRVDHAIFVVLVFLLSGLGGGAGVGVAGETRKGQRLLSLPDSSRLTIIGLARTTTLTRVLTPGFFVLDFLFVGDPLA